MTKKEGNALRKAAMANDVVAARKVIKVVALRLRCNPIAIDGHGCRALHYAAGSASCTVIRCLLHFYADPSAKDDEGRTPFYHLKFWEAKERSPDVLNQYREAESLLMDHGRPRKPRNCARTAQKPPHGPEELPEPRALALRRAAMQNDVAAAEAAIGESKVVQGRHVAHAVADAMHYAAAVGAPDVLRVLLDLEADPNMHLGSSAKTPLYVAEFWQSKDAEDEGHIAAAKLLKDRGGCSGMSSCRLGGEPPQGRAHRARSRSAR